MKTELFISGECLSLNFVPVIYLFIDTEINRPSIGYAIWFNLQTKNKQYGNWTDDLYKYVCCSKHVSTTHPRSTEALQIMGDKLRLQLHGAIYRPDSFVLMLRYCANSKAIRYESTSLKRIVADKSLV